jgi:flagellar basal-body rod modification protein FlgD
VIIDPTTSTTTTTQTSSAGAAGTQDAFLKLFMAQLEHQDPLDPKTGSDMAAQLAQFSQVEQSQQMNDKLSELAASQASQASATLSTLVGRNCSANAGDFTLDKAGSPPPLSVDATGPMKGASVVITDDAGKELRRIAIPDGTSSTQIHWDGKDASGKPVAPGSYHVKVDPGTTTATITSQWTGRIDAVELTADGPRLRMGDLLLSPGDVRTIGLDTSPLSPGVNA